MTMSKQHQSAHCCATIQLLSIAPAMKQISEELPSQKQQKLFWLLSRQLGFAQSQLVSAFWQKLPMISAKRQVTETATLPRKKKSTENTAFPAFLPSHEMMMMTVITTTGSDKNTFRFLVTSVVQYLWFVTYISLILFYREPVGFFLAF